jgi:hypothetical protein
MFSDLRLFAQSLANEFMETVVEIHPKLDPAKDPDNPFGDDTLRWGPPFTVLGWFVSTQTKNFSSVGGASSVVEDDTMRLPVGTQIKGGDKLVFNGKQWTAIDASSDDTWPAMLKVSITRIGDG